MDDIFVVFSYVLYILGMGKKVISGVLIAGAALSWPAFAADSSPRIGVYYFPGWKDGSEASRALPWEVIKKYPNKKPLIGWYPEGKIDVAEWQLGMMADHGIRYVIYDWYWKRSGVPRLEHAVEAYLKASNRSRIGFSILWANHTEIPKSLEEFDLIVTYWIKHYFSEQGYWFEDGCPVVFVFSPERLEKNARGFASSSKVLLNRARRLARDAGFKGIYFVGFSQAIETRVKGSLVEAGYDALSAYNYHFGLAGSFNHPKWSHSFEELSQGYGKTWNWILENSQLPYFIPVTAGWDRRPWGGSNDPLHDNSLSTPESFSDHLAAARKILNKYPEKTKRTVMICCWNEYGEGAYIEPTVSQGSQYLRIIKDILSKE
jgi:hypothetical protein